MTTNLPRRPRREGGRRVSAPRAYTAEEVREKFLDYVRALSRYWATLPGDKTPQERLDGLAFSILVAIDGGSTHLPAFDLAPAPHPDDEDFYRRRGENWYEAGVVINDCQLHELFYQEGAKR